MNKKELFSQILRLTADITGVSVDRITGNARDVESTDARYIVATLLHERGFYPSQIAECLHRQPRGIRWLLARQATAMLRITLGNARTVAAAFT